MSKVFLTPEQAIELLPDGDSVHTFINLGMCLCGADWSRNDIIDKINGVDFREVTGNAARGMKHGLALYKKDVRYQGDILFVETNMELFNSLYPEEELEDDSCE